MCGLHWEYPSFCIITGFYIPILSGVVLIFTGLRIRSTLRRRRHFHMRLCPNATETPGSVDSRQLAITTTVRQSNTLGSHRTLKILAFASVAYFMFWSPYVVVKMAQSFFSWLEPPPAVDFAVVWLANSNSAVNVFIYSTTNTQFRRQCVLLASRLCCSRLSCPSDTQDTNRLWIISSTTTVVWCFKSLLGICTLPDCPVSTSLMSSSLLTCHPVVVQIVLSYPQWTSSSSNSR